MLGLLGKESISFSLVGVVRPPQALSCASLKKALAGALCHISAMVAPHMTIHKPQA